MPNTSDPTDDLRAFFRDERRDEDHPEGDRLVAYHERRLSPEEQEEMRQHLAACPDCAAQLLELAALLDSEVPPGPSILPAEIEAAWERFAAGAKATASPAAPVPLRSKSPAGDDRSYRSSSRWAWGLAAVLALTTAWFSALALHQGRLVRKLEAPQAGQPLAILSSAESRGNVERESQTLTFEPGDLRGSIVLNLSKAARSYSDYEVRFMTGDGTPLFSLPVPEKEISSSSVNILNLDISRKHLPAGTYRIEVWGTSQGKQQKCLGYILRVQVV